MAQAALDRVVERKESPEESALSLIDWADRTFGSRLVMSTSFGIQSAVMLHLATRVRSDIPVIWIDTGYLPLETYCFAEQLREKLKLNLKVYQSPISPARMEALYGRLWEQSEPEALERYLKMRKVEPMERALRELDAAAWLAGLRRDQTRHRRGLQEVEKQNGRYKICPILGWTSRDVHQYLSCHGLPYHPFFEQGYATVGDWHSSRPMTVTDGHERETRFGGRKEECGLHLPRTREERESLDSSGL